MACLSFMTIFETYHYVAERLKGADIPEPEIESALILDHVLHLSRSQLFLRGSNPLPDNALQRIEGIVARRLTREPLAYILGEKEFWSRSFRVTPDVLIPRPETEQVIEAVLNEVGPSRNAGLKILDLGVGSGIISVILALELPKSTVFGVDSSCGALHVARDNAQCHGVADRAHYLCGDWLDPIKPGSSFDLIVSNPPYIATDELGNLQPELGFEPRQALDGGSDGLMAICRIARDAASLLQSGGRLFMEIGADQEKGLLELFATRPDFHDLEVLRDYAGQPRIFKARRR